MNEPAEDKNAQRIRIASGMAAKLLDSKIVPVWKKGTKDADEPTFNKEFISVREFLTRQAAVKTNFNTDRPREFRLMEEHAKFLQALETLGHTADPKVDAENLKIGAEILAHQIREEVNTVDFSSMISKAFGNSEALEAILGANIDNIDISRTQEEALSGTSGISVNSQQKIRALLAVYNGLKPVLDTLVMDIPPLDERVQRIRT